MCCIIGSVHTAQQYKVVARSLTLKTQSMSGKPDQRIEPVDRARKLSEGLHVQVVAFYVCELVQQNGANARPGPSTCSFRHNYDRAPHVKHKRRSYCCGFNDTQRRAKSCLPCQPLRVSDPRILYPSCCSVEPPGPKGPHQNIAEDYEPSRNPSPCRNSPRA